MKALVLEAYKQFAFTDVPEPTLDSRSVLVRVKAVGICGSDIHGMDGSTKRRIPPLIMGHEASGEIAAVGSDVRGWHVGDRVTFRLADYPFHGVISEDRGPLGDGGRRIYQIQADYGDEVLAIELGEGSLAPDDGPSNGSGRASPRPTREDDDISLPARLPNRRRKGEPRPNFHVGDPVTFQFGTASVTGKVTEDRGCIGVGGRRLYQITFDLGDELKLIELGEEDFQRLPNVGRP